MCTAMCKTDTWWEPDLQHRELSQCALVTYTGALQCRELIHLSYLLPPLFYCWFPPECFLFHLLHYSLLVDFFISCSSLLNLSCIFSILVCGLFICNSILFSRFWIIFTIIILNSFSGRLPISSSFVWFGGHLSSSFTC